MSPEHPALADLDDELFGESFAEANYAQVGSQWWLASEAGKPVAFAGAQIWAPDECLYLRRAGVLPVARGQGLQRRLIRARLAWGRELGLRGAYTYTAPWNLSSANNLIAEGFVLWKPSFKWGTEGALYWWKKLGGPK